MKVLLLIALLGLIESTLEADPNKTEKIDVLSLVECEDHKVPPQQGLICETEIVGEGPSKALNANVTIPFDLDDSMKFQAWLKQWTDGKWEIMGMTLTDTVCDSVHKYLPGLWKKLSQAANAPFDCPIKAGSYSVKGFTAEPHDVQLPFYVSGKFMITALLYKDDVPILCRDVEINITS